MNRDRYLWVSIRISGILQTNEGTSDFMQKILLLGINLEIEVPTKRAFEPSKANKVANELVGLPNYALFPTSCERNSHESVQNSSILLLRGSSRRSANHSTGSLFPSPVLFRQT